MDRFTAPFITIDPIPLLPRTNYGGQYQYIFAERRNDDYSCHHCVHFYVRWGSTILLG